MSRLPDVSKLYEGARKQELALPALQFLRSKGFTVEWIAFSKEEYLKKMKKAGE